MPHNRSDVVGTSYGDEFQDLPFSEILLLFLATFRNIFLVILGKRIGAITDNYEQGEWSWNLIIYSFQMVRKWRRQDADDLD